jgi:putative SOS response-associated peptidase YedK
MKRFLHSFILLFFNYTMCGRYILVQTAEFLERRFEVSAPAGLEWVPSYNIAPGKMAPVITNQDPDHLQLFRFGFTPSWASKATMTINARSEGDHNPENDPLYNGAKGIITKPAFKRAIREQRCLIPADAFIEGPELEKLSKPYLVYLQNKVRPFSLAGVWDQWKNPATGELISSFAIITTVANLLLQNIGHHRCPVILHREDEKKWLSNNVALAEITGLLRPYPAELMNAYPISPKIKDPKEDNPELIQPIGERILPEYRIQYNKDVKIEGMGSNKSFGFDEKNPWGS